MRELVLIGYLFFDQGTQMVNIQEGKEKEKRNK